MAKPSDVFPSLDAYHLYDRLKTVYHAERFSVPRLPALVELCIQAGVELPEYPTLRRKYPIKAIGKRIIEENTALFEFNDEVDPFADIVAETSSDSDTQSEDNYSSADSELDFLDGEESEAGPHGHDVDIDTLHYNGSDFLDENIFIEDSVLSSIFDANREMSSLSSEEVAHVAQVTLDSWQSMREGVRRLMSKYSVRVCGYCPEVHIGPRGHKVKICGAFKHQWRAGQHGWQKATLEDLIPPKYVWHVQNLNAPLLHNQLRRYYGQAPAVVELCVQAGAMIPEEFKPMMRLDIVVPDVDEIYHAV
ncbi:hypothetical protein KP509_05G068200 [Ceratopteris richardii]|nr:hypothetical protein KP509_05G068200 [Ceratopteris richardii]